MYTLQGLDKPGRSMVISLGRQAIYVPLLYGLTAAFGFSGFLFVYPTADLIISLAPPLSQFGFFSDSPRAGKTHRLPGNDITYNFGRAPEA
jgi:hypothetical protein